jgi:hypothetical protein
MRRCALARAVLAWAEGHAGCARARVVCRRLTMWMFRNVHSGPGHAHLNTHAALFFLFFVARLGHSIAMFKGWDLGRRIASVVAKLFAGLLGVNALFGFS